MWMAADIGRAGTSLEMKYDARIGIDVDGGYCNVNAGIQDAIERIRR